MRTPVNTAYMIWQQCRVFLDGNQQTTWWNKNTEKYQRGGGETKLHPLPSLRNTQTSATHTCINCMPGEYLRPSQQTLALSADFQTLSLPQSVSHWVPAVPSMLGEGADWKKYKGTNVSVYYDAMLFFNFINVYISHTHIHTTTTTTVTAAIRHQRKVT